MLDTLHSERFVDQSPAEVHATLLEEQTYLGSVRTMYRVLAEAHEVRERRAQARHPVYTKPELVATGPNQVWSWDITKLKGPIPYLYYSLYVILDLFSRYVVGWMVARHENAHLAERLIAATCLKQGIAPQQLTIHADRRRRKTQHFTQLDQVTQLVAARDADPELGFMARLLALCSLPRTNPKNRHEFKRVNGPYTLYMVAGGGNKLPYGTLPRLLLAWVCTEAVRTQSPELILGDSLSEFMRKVGIYSTSGDKHTRLRNQMRRLFGCTVSLLYEDARGEATLNVPIARLTEFWWSERQPDARSLWESKIELGEDFFNEIIRCPIPIDLNTLRAMKRSPLGLDLYLWLTYRTFALKRPLRLTWRQLYRQFGADQAKASKVAQQAFRRDCLRELKKIKNAWPDLHYQTVKGALLLSPSPPVIAPSQLRLVE